MSGSKWLYIGKRLLLLIPTVWGCATLTFFLLKLTPGDPAVQALGPKASKQALAALRDSWGLNDPLWQQYLRFLGDLCTGNLGTSYSAKAPVAELIATRLPVTLIIMVLAAAFAVVIALPLSVWVATSGNRVVTEFVRILNAVAQGWPTFFLGAILLQVFAIQLGWFPIGSVSGGVDVAALVLPSLAVAVSIAPIIVRSLTQSLQDSVNSEYVNFGKAKGLSYRKVLFGYALRNGSISAVSVLGIQVGFLVGGTLVVENVFAVPGLGQLLMDSVMKRDLPVVQTLTVVFGIIVVLVYLITDLVYGALDPRAAKRG
ncbi:ABC transporter permease subunit [Bifidobacterium sp. SMB2]|uniref:ABC transporter permease subunit n=1 Tax=Bifidobacterium saimiriisciurei TaxID=2661627 RepID=A0ABX0CB60_9BIFI|nr:MULTISPECIES: ABC transporter permease [Bifidobacterium]NEG96775.1 ABC transporter permease subunit [Bifidobacterium sp. SMB2]NEH12341.1 ABC transporter permease subunit [Bifidobacterium saimiriisciurei]